MGIYLNPGNEGFQSALRSQIYVDKTGMLAYTNSVLDTEQRYICVSRPRRFGKSITAEMLAAYYDRSCDSSALFRNRKIAEEKDYEYYRNQYDVIYLDVNSFRNQECGMLHIVPAIQKAVSGEIKEIYGD